jgi:hypothetical protein
LTDAYEILSLRFICPQNLFHPESDYAGGWTRLGKQQEGHPFRMLTLIDKYTRAGLAIDAGKQLKSDDVLEQLA